MPNCHRKLRQVETRQDRYHQDRFDIMFWLSFLDIPRRPFGTLLDGRGVLIRKLVRPERVRHCNTRQSSEDSWRGVLIRKSIRPECCFLARPRLDAEDSIWPKGQ